MLIAGKPPELLRRIDKHISADAVIAWVRGNASEFRIKHLTVEEGKRACAARFMFLGEAYDVGCIESAETPDPRDAVIRRCAWLMHRRLGVPTELEAAKRREMEAAIIEAAREGKTEIADKLGAELAALNESAQRVRRSVPTRFENFGGPLFERKIA